MKRALITGITGMDGSYMADLLLSKGYIVYGTERHKSAGNRNNIQHIIDKVKIIKADLADAVSLVKAIEISQPDEIYNFASQSFVGDSWILPEHTANITGLGVLRILEAIRAVKPDIRMVQASSSEMFGGLDSDVANEKSKFQPKNPYAIAKIFAHQLVENYRASYNMFICSSICFNHESERRGIEFVTRKITDGVARIHLGLSDVLYLGTLDTQRDWGYAPEYVEGIWKMLQQDTPEDFVFATGVSYSVRDFVQKAFKVVGILDWQQYVKQDLKFLRPVEVDYLKGDYTKAKIKLSWEPKVGLDELIERMVHNDIKLLRNAVYAK